MAKRAAIFGSRGGSATSEAKTDAARLNGKLGGRPRKVPLDAGDLVRRENLETAVARLQRARLLISSIEVFLTSDGHVLQVRERQSIERSLRVLGNVRRRVEVAEIDVPEKIAGSSL